MKLYNTLTRKKEEFIPIKEGEVKIYACGPTVYSYIHIGNARPICVFDVLRRYMEYIGYKVTFVQNFTDIDDKIIKKANEENVDFSEISKKYIEEYKKDAKGLNVRDASIHPKATENIEEIIKIIASLIQKGYAYSSASGDVYFKMRAFKKYGKLSHQSMDDLIAGARIEIEDEKEDALDFTLWKSAKAGEPMWKSPWGNGRPGWHIECSAMAGRYLGKTIDIHCGGQDLIFPHHENEIAQSECCNGVSFANYWLHNGYINIDSKKMSKSLNNFFTVRDVSEVYGYEPIRYLMISSHYRSPINYSAEIIQQCKAALDRLYNCRDNLDFILSNTENKNRNDILLKLSTYELDFRKAMDDDLNTADALSVLFEFVRDINTSIKIETSPLKESVCEVIKLFDRFTSILGILYNRKRVYKNSQIDTLIALRNEARKNKNWAEADNIRDKLKKMGVTVEDTVSGTKRIIKN